MRVRHLRLRNIKSYASQEDGTGVLVAFQPGINRIAGRNGDGKSTLIEALGYALFLSDPVFEENFQVQTYFLRAGEKHGEIEVAFEFEGADYLVIRSLGARNPVRDKVILGADQSLAAEGTAEVDAFLCRLFRLPDAGRLREWFAKLIGVKQGRLAWPFDTKPADARRHFEPLLDVDVFRQCFDRLKAVSDHLEDQRARHDVEAEGLRQRLLDRADSPERCRQLRDSLETLTREAQAAGEHLQKSQADVQRHETLETAAQHADLAARQAAERRQLAETATQHAAQRLAESQAAARESEATRIGSQLYTQADHALRQLLDQQARRDQLDARLRADTEGLAALDTRLAAARDQEQLLGRQVLDKTAAWEQGDRESVALTQQVDSIAGPLAQRVAARDAAARGLEALHTRMSAARVSLERQAGVLRDWETDAPALQAWDPARLTESRAAETQAAERAADFDRRLAAAREARAHLARQLTEISGGVCPFLREACRQFDASRVERDLSSQDRALTELEAAHRQASAEVTAARQRREAVEAKGAAIRQRMTLWASRFEQALQEHEEFGRGFLVLSLPAVGLHPAPTLPTWELPELRREAPSRIPPDGTWAPPFDLADLVAAHRRSLEAIGPIAQALADQLKEESASLATAQDEWNRHQARLFHLRQQGTAYRSELDQLTRQREHQRRIASETESATLPLRARIAQLRQELAAFASLAADLATQQELRQRHAAEHARHLAAAATAADLSPRTEAAARAAQALEAAQRDADEAATRAAAARAAFSAEALLAARLATTEAAVRDRSLQENLERHRRDLQLAETRLREWQEASRRAQEVRDSQARLATARDLNDRARRLLRDAAPVVAQHLCDRIARDAQQILARLHPEASQISWAAESYSLRLDPGERRFAMLSGGEQTKVALALTLAMIREFTTLRFCVFDEPTYGVDADSRERLARTVVELQQAAGFDQVLLVSHDDAFEGVIEHVVLLHKDAARGTRAVAG